MPRNFADVTFPGITEDTMTVFDSIQRLRDFPPQLPVTFVRAPNSNDLKTYVWDGDATATDNGYDTIKPSSLQPQRPGRWLLISSSSDEIDVTLYGLDPTGVEDIRVGLLQAIAAANASATRKIIQFPPGRFRLSTHGATELDKYIIIPSGVELRGKGMFQTIIVLDAASQQVTPYGNSTDGQGFRRYPVRALHVQGEKIRVSDVGFDGESNLIPDVMDTSSTTTETGLRRVSMIALETLDGSRNVEFKNIWFEHTWAQAMEGWGLGVDHDVDGFVVENVHGRNMGSTGISLGGDYEGYGGIPVRNGIVSNCSIIDGGYQGLTVYAAKDIIINNFQGIRCGVYDWRNAIDAAFIAAEIAALRTPPAPKGLGSAINIEYSNHITINNSQGIASKRNGLGFSGDSHHVQVNGSRFEGSTGTIDGLPTGEITFSPNDFQGDGVIRYPYEISIQNTDVEPIAGVAHVGVGTTNSKIADGSAGTQIPQSRSEPHYRIIGGNSPSKWTYGMGTTLNTHFATGHNIEMPRVVKEIALPDLDTWTKLGSASVTLLSDAARVTVTNNTTDAVVLPMTPYMGSPQKGLWYVRGVCRAVEFHHPYAPTANSFWDIGLRRQTGTAFFGKWEGRMQPTEGTQDVEFFFFSRLDEVQTDIALCLRNGFNGTRSIDIKYIVLGLIDGKGIV